MGEAAQLAKRNHYATRAAILSQQAGMNSPRQQLSEYEQVLSDTQGSIHNVKFESEMNGSFFKISSHEPLSPPETKARSFFCSL